MKFTIAILALSIYNMAQGAPKPQGAIDRVLTDQYFLSGNCANYLGGLSEDEQVRLSEASDIMVKDESIRYVTRADSIVEDLKAGFSKRQIRFNTALDDGRKKLVDTGFVSGYEDETYSEISNEEALRTWKAVARGGGQFKAQSSNASAFVFCRIAVMASGMGTLARFHELYISYALSKVKKASIGFFDVSVDKAEYGSAVNTGNRYAEPKHWQGSRFLTVFATFKNTDTESRQPQEGSLFITYNGKEYEYDAVEPISLEGYNIWFRKINPLVTMKTKIVYRIPDEIEGVAYWRPGRNVEGTKLWLGYVKAAKN